MSGWSSAEIEARTPAALPHLIETLLADHVGEQAALPTSELLARVRERGVQVDERQIRSAVRELRRFDMLICSSQSGYFLPANLGEVLAFLDREIRSRAYDMLETARKLESAARAHFREAETGQRVLF